MKKSFLTILILILAFTLNFGQKLLSEYNFANFLFLEKEYTFAAQEYERLYFTNPDSIEYFKMWMRSTRLANNSSKILDRLKLTSAAPTLIQWEYCKAAIQSNKNELAYIIIKAHNLSNVLLDKEPKFAQMKFGIDLMSHYKNTDPVNSENHIFQAEIDEYRLLKTKSIVLSGISSAIIPGSGRVYVGEYTNAILSLIFIAGSAYQSNARFKKNGIKSVSGWIYGGISFGFYIGNIYGSIKSTKAYNKRNKNKIDDKVKQRILAL